MNRPIVRRLAAVLVFAAAALVAAFAYAQVKNRSVPVTTTPAQLSNTGTGYTGATHFINTGTNTVFLLTNTSSSDPAPSASTCLSVGAPLPAGATIAKIDPSNFIDLSLYYACTATGSSTLIVFPQ